MGDLLSLVGEQVASLLRDELSGTAATLSLLEHARQRGVEGLVAEHLIRTSQVDQTRAEAKTAFIRNFCQSAAYQGRLADLEKAFRAAEVEAIALKGLPLSLTIFASKVGTRELSDIDLLFRPEQLARVRDLLEQMGYVLRGDTDMGYQQEGYYLDLHVRLFDRVDRAYSFDVDTVWESRERLTDDFEAIQGLESHLNFCYLAAHAMDHGFSRLKWLVDLVLMLPQCDGERLREAALKSNSLDTVLVSLKALKELFDVKIPNGMASDVSQMGWFEASFAKKIAANKLPLEAGKFFAVWNAADLASRAEVLRRLVAVEGESLSHRLRRVTGALKGLIGRD